MLNLPISISTAPSPTKLTVYCTPPTSRKSVFSLAISCLFFDEEFKNGGMELMAIATIIQTALIIIILGALLVGGFFTRLNKGAYKFIDKLRGNGTVESTAIVLNIEETGVWMNQHPLMKLQVQVTPDKGRNFVVEIKEVVAKYDLSDFKPGNKVKVRYVPGQGRAVELVRKA